MMKPRAERKEGQEALLTYLQNLGFPPVMEALLRILPKLYPEDLAGSIRNHSGLNQLDEG
jgi:hypothetical protein